MTNPFDDEDGTFYVLINDEGQYCLRPTFVDVPAGWNCIYEPASGQACLDNINQTWTDMRLRSLFEADESRSCSAEVTPSMRPWLGNLHL
jgi:MbtH protein